MFESFEYDSSEAWWQRIREETRGTPAKPRTEDGIDLSLFYSLEDSSTLESERILSGAKDGWKKRHVITDPLKKGKLDEIRFATGWGIDSIQIDDAAAEAALEAGMLFEIESNLFIVASSLEKYTYWRDITETDAKTAFGRSVQLDFLSIVEKDSLEQKWFKELRGEAENAHILIDGRSLRERGLNRSEEIAWSISLLSEILALSTGPAGNASCHLDIEIRLGTSSAFLEEIVKTRALKILAVKVMGAYSRIGSVNLTVHVSGSLWNRSPLDPHVNLIRNTSEAIAAVLGEADCVSMPGFRSINGEIDVDGCRWAINVQHILALEAGLQRVVDPLAGAWFVERLTTQTADRAWSLFQEIEANGGFQADDSRSTLAEQLVIGTSRRTEEWNDASRRMIGSNVYPLKDESHSINEWNRYASVLQRPLHGYEKLRREMDAFTSSGADRPTVLNLKIGNPREAIKKAEEARACFEVAGYRVLDSRLYETLSEALSDLSPASFDCACICASEGISAHLDSADPEVPGHSQVAWIVAGKPLPELRSVISGNWLGAIQRGHESVAILRRLHDFLGVSRHAS